MDKKKKIIIGSACAALTAANAVHAAVFKPKKSIVPKFDLKGEKADVDRYRRHLSEAITIRTISHSCDSDTDWTQFEKLQEFFEREYPLIHKNLEKEIVPPANLIFRWKGSKSDLDPIALLGHQDVVPVNPGTEDDWEHPPFEGHDDGEYIWGRGALDMKNHVIGVLEAVETLLEEGFEPERDVYILLGDNEEVVASETNGATAIMETLKSRGVHLDCILDEGGAMLPVNIKGVLNNKYLAGIGIAEKGYADVKITVTSKGGHSSQPPKHSALGKLAGVISDLENNQFPSHYSPSLKALFDSIARNCTYPVRLIGCNLPLLLPALKPVLKMIPPAACMIRTTTGVTMASGSPAPNVLPQKASVTVNFRMMPGTSTQDVLDHIRKVVRCRDIELEVYKSKEPSSTSPTDSRSYRIISRLCRGMEPGAIVAPYLVMGGTDACYYEPICENIYRYAPFKAGVDLLLCTHGTNERIPVNTMKEGIVFFKNYIRQASAEV